MKPDFIIRTIKLSDIETIIELEEKYLGESIGFEMLKNEMNNKYAYFLVGTLNEKIIGYLGAWLLEGVAEVINFVIDKEYWHQGYGTALWQALEALARNKECNKIFLEVKEKNTRALKFYEKHNLVRFSMRYQYYHDDSNAIVMMKVI